MSDMKIIDHSDEVLRLPEQAKQRALTKCGLAAAEHAVKKTSLIICSIALGYSLPSGAQITDLLA